MEMNWCITTSVPNWTKILASAIKDKKKKRDNNVIWRNKIVTFWRHCDCTIGSSKELLRKVLELIIILVR